jgi:hypothetical protein
VFDTNKDSERVYTKLAALNGVLAEKLRYLKKYFLREKPC